MKRPFWLKAFLIVICAVIIFLPTLTQNVFAAEVEEEDGSISDVDEDDGSISDAITSISGSITSILEKLKSLPRMISEGILDDFIDRSEELIEVAMFGVITWLVQITLEVTETIFTHITASSANIFNFDWFNVIVGVFSRFGTLLFAVGVVLALADVGIEYRRRGADIGGAMLNLGKGLLAVGLFSTVPVPFYTFCVNIQSVIMNVLAINWSFQDVSDALRATFAPGLLMVIMLIVIIVLMCIIYLDTLKRGGILLVQICIGSLYMISVPRGYMDNFYGWCKQVIALCLTTLFQNLLMFCGLMIIPTNLFLGIGTMVAAKEVPRICGQFGLDTSVKASFTNMAMGANASVQAIKTAAALLA